MRRLVFYPILSFATCSVLSGAELQLDVSDESLTLSIDLAVEGYQHYRIDGSTDLSQWDAIASINLSDGLGVLEFFPAVGEQLPEQMFYRVQEDDSASNVLDLPETLDDYENINLPEHLATVEEIASDNTPVDNPLAD